MNGITRCINSILRVHWVTYPYVMIAYDAHTYCSGAREVTQLKKKLHIIALIGMTCSLLKEKCRKCSYPETARLRYMFICHRWKGKIVWGNNLLNPPNIFYVFTLKGIFMHSLTAACKAKCYNVTEKLCESYFAFSSEMQIVWVVLIFLRVNDIKFCSCLSN